MARDTASPATTNGHALVAVQAARSARGGGSTNGSVPAANWEPVDAWVSIGNGAAAAVSPAPSPSSDPAAKADLRDLYELVEELKLEVRRLNRVVETLTEANRRVEREAVREEIDARFKWLTEQVSERLVTLGNEMVAMRRHLEQHPTDSAS